ncbi:PQQ-dependent sugar dehydrogenase [Halorarius litoreus]|uniref:PQQ-dependent sugar dehydrogenase n=1 Tax=Halorarius litoreus TaxID=2962676 RepID=UPI0020CDC80C|nr:PQQ-dependent sugar dehydrogenase [Halorarius litoreus]
MHRRTFLTAALAGGAMGLAGCSGTAGPGTATDTEFPPQTASATPERTPDGTGVPARVALQPVATGLSAPVDVVFPSADHRYVAEQSGIVYVQTETADEPLLDLRDRVETGGEKGLLGLALHPSDETRLFVRYSAPSRSGTPANYSHTFVLAEFTLSADGMTADPDSERTLLEIPQPQSNHNAGSIVFGPDGYLYVGVGDGGAGGDRGTGHADDWYDAVDGGNGQDVTENLLGSVLRLDVDAGTPYAVPDDNPLVGRDGLDEQFAWGFRNPWRMSFDGDDLYVADVGQSAYEEVSLVEKGSNYGWNVREATHCFGPEPCPESASVRGGEPLVDPVIEYPHSGGDVNGISVIGGYVYRGAALPGLHGRYVFGDLNAGGRLFVATPTESGLWPLQVLPVAESDTENLGRLLSFGRDLDGELYALAVGESGAGVYRIVSV